jgi:hypothetical protein
MEIVLAKRCAKERIVAGNVRIQNPRREDVTQVSIRQTTQSSMRF